MYISEIHSHLEEHFCQISPRSDLRRRQFIPEMLVQWTGWWRRSNDTPRNIRQRSVTGPIYHHWRNVGKLTHVRCSGILWSFDSQLLRQKPYS